MANRLVAALAALSIAGATAAQTAVSTPAQTAAPTAAQAAVPKAAQTAVPTPAQTAVPTPAKTAAPATAKIVARAVDIPTIREGVTQRFLYLPVERPKAAVVLFTGGHGGLQIGADGSIAWGRNNFLVRTREQFVRQGLAVALIDAPSDQQEPPYLRGVRQGPDHLQDVRALIVWLRKETAAPVWLVGMSRGTQSVGFVATQLPRDAEGPDGIVLAASIMRDPREPALPAMPLERIAIPVLLVHHKDDACRATPYDGVPEMLERFKGAPRRALITAEGGRNRGDPCEAFAYHDFHGLEAEVVSAIARWMLQP